MLKNSKFYNMEVQIISKKLISPSSPTSRRDIKISCIDQLAPPSYVQIIFYFDVGNDREKFIEKCAKLEKSLSETLSIFYPLAGRYDENDKTIDCGGQGIEFLETRVKGNLGRVLERSDPNMLCRFVACGLKHSLTAPLVSVQVNGFECGGLALGLSVSHVVADAYTFSLFSNAWANACRSKTDQTLIRPNFDLGSVFPPRDLLGFEPRDPLFSGKDVRDIVTRRFVFDVKSISRLKAKVSPCRPSRVQVVTALIWTTLVKVAKSRHGQARASMMTHAFNLRGKTKLPLPENSCGNLWRLVIAKLAPNDDVQLEGITGIVVDSLTSATSESAKPSLSRDDVFWTVRNAWEEVRGGKDGDNEVVDFTSWCNMGHYEVDFGWGRPSWVGSTCVPADGYVILMDARDGFGIEAWVSLEEEKMLLFERDRDFASFMTKI